MHKQLNNNNMDLNCCRLCLKLDDDIIHVFSEYGVSQNIQNILNKHFWFEVKDDDIYSSKICPSCWKQVESFHLFYSQVYESHHNFLVKDIQDFLKSETIEDSEEIKKEGYVIADNKVENLAMKLVDSDTDNAEITAVSEAYKDTMDSNTSDSSSDKHTRLKSTPKNREKKSLTAKKLSSTKTKIKKTPEQLAMIEKDDQSLREYFKMSCELCSFQFHVFQNVKTHYRVAHQLNGFLSCCNKKFLKRCKALEHIRWHLNPEDFNCDICKKTYTDKSGLELHMLQHLPSDKKPFKCEKCSKTYAKNSLLRQHQIYRHATEDDKSFFCDECGKAFITNYLLQTHKRGVHEGAFTHVCEVCAKSFKSKYLFQNHMNTFHSNVVLPKVQCKTCGTWLKNKPSLKKHMQLHENKTYNCDLCNKQAPSRGALLSHKKYVHLNERNHKCSICDKAFKKEVALREHMTTHTGEVLYKCPYCPKTFNSSANFHSHRKKIHTKEWEQRRQRKTFNNLNESI